MHTPSEIYLIDGSAYVYRAFHAIRSLRNSQGLPTNAIFGFTRMLIKLLDERRPAHIGMFFDAKGPTFRHARYPAYKANRPPMPEALVVQLPHIKNVTAAFNIPVLELPGYEADDLIGTVARQAEKEGFQVVLVTGDKDFVQLLSPGISIWDPMKDRIQSVETLRRANGIDPAQMIDVMGLAGDTSDNVPGVPGIGPKTALDLIRAHGSLEGVYAHLADIKSPKQRANLESHRAQAELSRELVRICTAAPLACALEDFRCQSPDSDRLSALFQSYEFRQLQQTFAAPAVQPETHYAVVLTEADLDTLIERLARAERFALDTETTATDPMRAELVGISVAWTSHAAHYIPCGHRYLGAPPQLDRDHVLARLRPLLENPAQAKLGQNIKYDWIVLERHGIDLRGVVFDTMIASYLVNPSKRSHSLDQIAMDFLNHKTITYAEVAGKGRQSVGFDMVPLEKAVPYACEDADVTLRAAAVLEPALAAIGLTGLMQDVEMPLVPVLKRMEMTGVRVDRRRLELLGQAFEKQLAALEDDIQQLAGEAFNVKSSQQLGQILFEKLNLPVQKKTKKKTAYSTDVEVLTKLADQHPLPAMVLRHRVLAKLKSTYVDALIGLIHPATGRIHTSFNQTVTATGRLSSSEPNLQNIPIRTAEGREIRKAFIPRPGWKILSADYSQVELRILAHCAADEILIQAFVADEDIHARTACEVFEITPELITDELRRHAKVINFGIIYGMGPYSLSQDLGISQSMAKTYIDNYFAHYRGVKDFIDRTIAQARQTKQTTTLLGRIRLLPDIDSPNRSVREFAERTAVNTPIQGTAADLIKLAMLRVETALRREGLQTEMLLSVHDEIVLEAPGDEVANACRLLKRVMEGVWDLAVPLKVNVAVGDNWAEAHA